MTRQRREAIRKAENLVSRGKLEAAVKQYEKVLRSDASDTSTLNRLGDLYVRLKRMDEATELFRRAGEHFSREGFFVKAIAIFKKIIRLDPTRIDVYEILADLYHRQGLINEARTQYQVVGDYYAQNGETAKVVAINERMVELEPDHPTLRVRLAELYCDVGRTSDAMQQYREIATFMLAHSKVDEAVRVYQGALDLDPQDQAYLTDAILHLKDEGYAEAAADLLRYAVDLNPAAAKVAVLTGLAKRPATETADGEPAEREATVPVADKAEPVAAAEDEVEATAAESPGVEPGGTEQVMVEAEPEIEAEEAGAEEATGAPPRIEEVPAELAAESTASDEAAPEPERDEALFLDLEEPAEVPYAVERDPALDDSSEIEIDLDLAAIEPIEEAAPEPEPAPAAEPGLDPALVRAEELFHEARVLANYGLEDKASELLAAARELMPDHLGIRLLAARVSAVLGRDEEAAGHATAVLELGVEAQQTEEWRELTSFLVERGFEMSETSVGVPPAPEPAVVEEPPAAEPTPVEVPQSSDHSLDWLEEPRSEGTEAGAAELFGEEQDFFDLAGELEEELLREDLLGEEFDPQPTEQTLEEIVEGFRKGVAETLAAEDYDTHYNLGIAYREMGLVDEAIGEFQLAAKDPRYLVDCCSLLGSCFLEKGFPDLAVKWYERGLESPNLSEKEGLGLLYELGNLYVATGETESALETFTEIYGTNSNYRDVVARLAELGGGD